MRYLKIENLRVLTEKQAHRPNTGKFSFSAFGLKAKYKKNADCRLRKSAGLGFLTPVKTETDRTHRWRSEKDRRNEGRAPWSGQVGGCVDS